MKKFFPKYSYLLVLAIAMFSVQVGMSQTTVTVDYTTGGFNGENGWKLVDVTAGTEIACFNNPPGVANTYTITDGNEFELQGYETFGDGWCPPANINLSLNLPGGGSIELYDGNTGAAGNGSASCGNAAAGQGAIAFSGVIALPNCQLTVPADITASTLPGTCEGGFVEFALPTANEDCLGVPACLVDVPSGVQQLNMQTTLAQTDFDITGVPTFAAAEVAITGNWNSDNSFQTETPEVFVDGILIGTLNFGGADCAPTDIFLSMSAADYNTAAADGTLSITIGADSDVNNFCASNTIELNFAVPECTALAINDYNGTEDASDIYPLGETVVCWTSADVSGLTVTECHTVTIEDLEGPVFANCLSDLTITLDPGDCNYTLNFDTTATDNCPPTVGTVAGPYCDPCADPSGGSALACSGGTNSFIQAITLPNAGIVSGFVFNQESFGTAPNVTINVYENDGSGNVPYEGGGFTPLYSETFALDAGNDGSCVTLEFAEDVEVTVASLWLEVYTTFGRAVQTPPTCDGNSATGMLSYLVGPACGISTPTLASGIGFALDASFAVLFAGGGTEVVQDSELGNGDVFPIGTTVVQYTAIDGSGNTSVCSFNVTVEEYPEELQTSVLACNGGINFSVDASCTAVITADMVLEGGPYGCYEDFVLEISGIPAGAMTGNGTNAVEISADLIAEFVANGVYGPFEISVFDPEAMNNSCWHGDFMLEDKLPPVFECDNDVTIACTTDNAPSTATNPSGALSLGAEPGTAIVSNAPAFTTDPISIAGLPAGAVITEISLDLDISHTWIGDLNVSLNTPAGEFVVIPQSFGCANDNIDATFIDGGDPLACTANNPSVTGTVEPADPFAALVGSSAVGDFSLTVSDDVGGDEGTLNSFAINIAWEVVLPSTPAIVSDECSGVTVEYSDEVVDGDCTSDFASVITRTWTAVDAAGNVAESCVQTISVTRETLATITLPSNWDGLPGNNPVIECDATVLNGAGELDPGFYGSPSGAGACGTIISYYTDVVLPICDDACSYSNNTYKVVRKWTILDWCTGEILEPTQILKVVDTTAPVLSELNDITVSTDIWGCGATIELPVAAATDNCTADESISYVWSSSAGTYNAQNNTFVLADPAQTTPGAPVVITATASDCCGNSSTTSFEVTVADLVPPVVVAETTRTVSLTTDGTAKIFAESFDDGSHDGCGPIGFSVKRMDNGSPCTSVYTSAENFDNANFTDKVFFCCADTDPVMVQFRVCDDADMNGITGSFGDNCNTAMVEVVVQDKLAPVIVCPPNTEISCVDLAGIDLTDTDLLDGLFGAAQGAGTCDVEITQVAVGNENCGAGVIFRNFTATNAAGSSSCQQIITVTAGTANTLTCDRISFAGLNNGTYNWCAVNDGINDNDDDLPAVQIECQGSLDVPVLDIDINGLCTEAGVSIEVDTFQFAGGACQKYLVHYEVIDQCLFDENYVDPVTGQTDPYNSDNGYFEFYLEIDAFDNEDPVPACEDITVAAGSCTGINAEITVTATDNCTDPEFFGFQWRLDVGANNTIDFPASGWYASSSVTPGQVGLSEFPIGTHRVFWIISDGCGNDATCSQLVTITANEKEPTPYCFDGLATAVMPSTGTVALWANDFDAGSFDNCPGELVFSMVPEQDVVDLTADEAYDLSFTGTQQPNGDYGWEFDCSYIENGISAVIEVRVYVTDVDGNWDYCTASLRLDDNFDACEDGAGTVTYNVTGKLQTESGDDVADTDVTVEANFPEFPMTETVTGGYSFDLVELVDYSIIPAKNDNHLNGVTTLDIVMIQKHILGLDLLDSPYQLIAADVNNDCNVTGSDLVQVRKLILGKYPNEQFPSNDSWRFVEGDYNFTNPEAPCNFSEVAEIFNLSAEEINDFVAIKVADVNATAVANATMTAETRSADNLDFVVVDQTLSAGTNRVDVLAKDFNEVYGFQYTMSFSGAEFVSVEAGALNVTENNFGLNANGNLLVSFDNANGVSVADDAVLFTIVVNASNNTLVSDAISMNSNGVAAEAYIGRNLEVLGSDIVFRTNEGDVAANAFSLFQNEPNPFNGATVIGFELPATAEATLSVYDVTGKVLYTRVNTFSKGYNTVTLTRDELASTGVLYYKLESGNNVATMKMIIID